MSHLSSKGSPWSEPSSLASSPHGSPVLSHRHQNGHVSRHRLDGYSSLGRLNKRQRVNKCNLEKLFLRPASLEILTTNIGSSSEGTRHCISGGSSSSDEEAGEMLLDTSEFARDRKERSTVLVRRFFKNNQKVGLHLSANKVY